MRVLLLGPYPPPYGGVQTHLVAIQQHLLGRGEECEVINITGAAPTAAPGVHYPRSAPEVLRLLVSREYDIVHLHVGGSLPPRVLALAAVCTSFPTARSVFTFHSGGYPSSPDGQAAAPGSWRGLVLRRFDRLIGVNAELVQLFRRFGAADERIRLIEPHSVPDLPGDAALESSPSARAVAAFLAEHDPVLLSVGLLEPEYDLAVQIEAISRVRASHASAGLVMIGSGSQEAELRARIASSPDAAHILLAGDVPHAATLATIARADVLLRTTLYDGDAISVREALHLGTPVVATDNGMRPAGVRLVPVGRAGAVADAALAAVAGGRPERAGDGARASGTAENIEAVYELYRELCVPSASRSARRR